MTGMQGCRTRGGKLFTSLWKQTDHRLIELCIEGHAPAWECLVKRYKNLVYHFPTSAGLKAEDADEVFQETYLSLYRGLEKLKEVEALDQWVATVAKRTTWRIVNRQRRRYEDEFPEAYDVPDPDLVPEDLVALKLEQHRVRKALASLNEKCRNLLTTLFYKYESADYDQIAQELNLSRGSIGPLRHRCLARFKKVLEDMGVTKKSVSKWLA